MTTHRLTGTLLLLASALLAVVGTVRPIAYAACAALLMLGGAMVVASRFPRAALVGCVYAVLLAETKFRIRSASESLSARIDAQIVLELGLYAAIVVILAVVISRLRIRFARPRSIEMLLAAYVALAGASVVWSDAPAMTMVRAVQLAILFVTALVLVRVHESQDVLRVLATPLLWYVTVCATIATILPQARGVIYEYNSDVPRYAWFALHPIAVASLTGIGLVFLVERFTRAGSRLPPKTRVGLALLAVAFFGVALLTRSRGPLAAMLAGALMVVLAPRLRPVTLAAAMSASAAGLFALEVSNTSPMELLKDWSREGGVVASVVFRNQDADQVAGFSGRGELWAGVTPLIMDRPLLGRGYQGSRAALLETMPWAGYAHNSLMQSLLDLGIVGSLMLFFGFGSAFLVGSLRGSVIDATVYRTRLTILGVCTFELLNGVSDEVFAGAPGYQTLLVLACVCLAARVRQARFEVVTAQQPVWYAWPTGHQAPNWSGQMPLRAADGLNDANRSPRPVDAHGA